MLEGDVEEAPSWVRPGVGRLVHTGNQVQMSRRRVLVVTMGAVLAGLCLLAGAVWSDQRPIGTKQVVADESAVPAPGAFDPSSKQQELAIIQRAIYDDEHGTTPPRVLAEEREEAAQQKLEKATEADEKMAEVALHKEHARAEKKAKEAAAAALAAANKESASMLQKRAVTKHAQSPALTAVQVAAAHTAATSAKLKAQAAEPSKATAFHFAATPLAAAPSKAAVGSVAAKPLEAAASAKARHHPSSSWQREEKQIKSEYGEEISLEQKQTLKKVTQLKDDIEKQVAKVLKEGKEQVAKIKRKEKAAVTVVRFDKREADLKEQLHKVQAQATAQVTALQNKLRVVHSLEKKYGSNPKKPLTEAVSVADAKMIAVTGHGAMQQQLSGAKLEDFSAESASHQKKMRDKVKLDAYAKSKHDVDLLQNKLEDALEREVLSMDKHPALHTAAKAVAKRQQHGSKHGSSKGKAGAASVAPKSASPPVSKKRLQELKAAPGGSATPEHAVKAGAEAKGGKAASKPAAAASTSRAPRQEAAPHAPAHEGSNDSRATQREKPSGASPKAEVKQVKQVKQATASVVPRGDDSPAAQIMKMMEQSVGDAAAAAAEATGSSSSAAAAASSAPVSSLPSASHHAPTGSDSASVSAHSSHTSSGSTTRARALAHQVVVAPPAVLSKWQKEVQWAEKHGMPAKMAGNRPAAKKIIARMKAQAILQKLENSIKSDQSFVKQVETKAEEANK